MKGILKWFIGPNFDFMPSDITNIFRNGNNNDTEYSVDFNSNELLMRNSTRLSNADWTSISAYEDVVKFINQSIEWENVLYFLYSYFWNVPYIWEFIKRIRHYDSTRESFLRAGSACIVLTVRPDFEEGWIKFIEYGIIGRGPPSIHPYLTIVNEIENFNKHNYPGIPPPNPARSDNHTCSCNEDNEKGILIAEWNEYIPSSGTDIAVTFNLSTIA